MSKNDIKNSQYVASIARMQKAIEPLTNKGALASIARMQKAVYGISPRESVASFFARQNRISDPLRMGESITTFAARQRTVYDRLEDVSPQWSAILGSFRSIGENVPRIFKQADLFDQYSKSTITGLFKSYTPSMLDTATRQINTVISGPRSSSSLLDSFLSLKNIPIEELTEITSEEIEELRTEKKETLPEEVKQEIESVRIATNDFNQLDSSTQTKLKKWAKIILGKILLILVGFYISLYSEQAKVMLGIENESSKEIIENAQEIVNGEMGWGENSLRVTTRNVEMRKGPGRKYPLVEVLPTNNVVIAYDKHTKSWIQVVALVGDIKVHGWILRKYTYPLNDKRTTPTIIDQILNLITRIRLEYDFAISVTELLMQSDL